MAKPAEIFKAVEQNGSAHLNLTKYKIFFVKYIIYSCVFLGDKVYSDPW